MPSIADFVSSLREHNARALDLLLLERLRGKVGRGLAVQLSRRRDNRTQVKCRAAPALAGHSSPGGWMNLWPKRGIMAVRKQKFAVKRRECRVAVISEERILGKKFFRPTRERPSPGAETLLVAKTGPLVTAIACGVACVR